MWEALKVYKVKAQISFKPVEIDEFGNVIEGSTWRQMEVKHSVDNAQGIL